MAVAPYLFVGDDFTGACDTLATLARAGLRTRLLPGRAAVLSDDLASLDALGIATDLRALPPEAALATLDRLIPVIAPLAPRIVHLKVCSTFDSAPGMGNIRATAATLAAGLGLGWTAVIGGQPSLGRYCLFGTLFAAASDGQVYRIDRHPVMAHHPITPMAEADLTRHLARQVPGPIGLIDYRAYAEGPASLLTTLRARMSVGETCTLFDVSKQADLALLGQVLRALSREVPLLCIGASSVAEALMSERSTPRPSEAQTDFDGPLLAIAGSRSPVTAMQVARATRYQKIVLDPADLSIGATAGSSAVERAAALLGHGENALIVLSDRPDPEADGGRLARAMAELTARILGRVRPGCVIVAGGDTSSAIVQALEIDGLNFLADIDRGVPLVAARSGGVLDGLPLVLKGGQMGAADLLDNIATR